MSLLRNPPANHPPSDVKVAIVTGLSNPRSTRLSAVQHTFLDTLPVPEPYKVRSNFPFVETRRPKHEPSLLAASWNNGYQFASSLRRRFRKEAKPHWQALCDSTDRLLIITGSCGQQLIDALEDCDRLPNVAVLALGPVRLRSSRFVATKILGSRDWIARWFTPNCDHLVPGVGHLDYWKHETVIGIATTWTQNNLSGSSVQEATCHRNA